MFFIRLSLFTLFIIWLSTAMALAQAQVQESWDEEAAKKDAQREVYLAAEGEAIKVDISSSTITLRSPENEVYTYFINLETTFTAADSLSDIAEGDYISIDYYVYKDKRIADNIALEKKNYRKEAAGEDQEVPKVLVDK